MFLKKRKRKKDYTWKMNDVLTLIISRLIIELFTIYILIISQLIIGVILIINELFIIYILIFKQFTLVGTRGESPPSFCNGLGIIYIVSSRERTFWSYYQIYGFGVYVCSRESVRHPRSLNLRLASHHCVLRLNLIKNMFNTCILTLSLTHTLAYI